MRDAGISEPGDMIKRVDLFMDKFNVQTGKPYKLNISIGFREFNVDAETMKILPSYMEYADRMLYVNKRKHKAKLSMD